MGVGRACSYNRAVKIYTKTGDAGETSLFDGTRVPKTDPRVVAYGEVDELQACLGVAAAAGLDAGAARHGRRRCSATCSRSARGWPIPHTASRRASRRLSIDDDSIARLEGWIDRLEAELPPLRHFILAGGAPAGAALHLARTVCRRAERAALSLGDATPSNRSCSSISIGCPICCS